MIEPDQPKSNMIETIVRDAIKSEAERLVKEAQKDLEKRTPEIIAGLVVEIMGMSQFEIAKDRIIFTIKKDNP